MNLQSGLVSMSPSFIHVYYLFEIKANSVLSLGSQ